MRGKNLLEALYEREALIACIISQGRTFCKCYMRGKNLLQVLYEREELIASAI